MQRNFPFQFQFDVRGWAAVAVGLALLAALAFLAVGLFILILPLMLLAPILFWFLPKPKVYRVGTPSQKPPPTEATIIEGEFKVIDHPTDRISGANDA
jgi:hypothetical protein